MRLVRLEMRGFKSFARETVLHFGGADVVGVVGPNGSGKSNIVDAIRWVLGERKVGELRLDKMSSVIFNGTKTRKAGNVAQVFLTFDNDQGALRTDFAEVTIGRLLFRNGDSEYRLNGVTCRRRDITDLFRDTGVAGDSYAIIALGMVDDILADRDNSRLKMLEQAAGITVYKSKKKEALQRLGRTREDLDRVEDLLHEIDGNLKELERQAKRARKHKDLLAAYREVTLDYAYANGSELRANEVKIDAELSTAEAAQREQQQQLTELEQRVDAASEARGGIEQQLAEARRQLGNVVSALRIATQQHQLSTQKLGYLEQGTERWLHRETELEADRERLSKASSGYAQRLGQTRQEFGTARQKLEAAQAELGVQRNAVQQIRKSARQRLEEVLAADKRFAEADRQVVAVQARLEVAVRDQSSVKQQAASDAQRLASAQTAFASAETEARTAAKQLAEAEALAAEQHAAAQQARQNLDALADQLATAKGNEQRLTGEASLLESVLHNMAGASDSIRYLGVKHGWRGTYPQLSDLLDIAPPARLAVERALGPLVNSFVVPDLEVAKAAVQVLAKAGQAAVTILVSSTAGHEPGATTQVQPTSLRHQVKVDEQYAPLLDALLGTVLIDDGQLLAWTHQVLVDAQGKTLRTATGLNGGAVSATLGAQTGRLEQLAELTSQISEAQANVLGVERAAAKVRERLRTDYSQTTQQAVTASVSLARSSTQALATARAQLQTVEQVATSRHTRQSELAAAVQQLEAQLQTKIEARDAAALGQADVLGGETTGGNAQSAEESLERSSAAYNGAHLSFVRLENTVASLEREEAFAVERTQAAEAALQEGQRLRDAEAAEASQLRVTLTELDVRIVEGTKLRTERQESLDAQEKDYLSGRDASTQDERQLRDLQRQLNSVNDLVTRLRERRAEVNFKLSALAERLSIEFDLQLDDALLEERTVELPIGELRARADKLKRKLDGYGQVNPLALEAFDAMDERHRDITQQRDDILEAATALEGTIGRLDHEATDKLQAAFEAVRGHFVEVFRHLFDAEDTADMVMLDPDNPLESKIEIVARPKGKRPQTISQLSGGEKTLTATAFLFALYLIKPAPFCIFDEVDAPLDDANVEKFNRIIKRFSADSQFVVITHNKLTMAAVDTIYGVYMSELGVSAVTQVDFSELSLAEVVG